MNGKEIMDHAANILRRQDLDRKLLLLFINTARRTVFQGKRVRCLFSFRENLPMENGLIDADANRIKSAHVVEWFKDNGDGTTVKVSLAKLFSYRQAMDLFGSLLTIGEPQAFLEMESAIRVLPVPIPGAGQINVFGEFWPGDVLDSQDYSDVTTIEMPEALVYLGASEYYDFLGEAQKGQYWRQKGLAIVESYLAQMQKMEYEHYDVWKRRPFGKGTRKARVASYSGFTVDNLDMGEWL